MKRIISVLALILLSFTINAQNVTMAKAFYKKAKQEYEYKNYQEVINLLEKTKENLDGETNPDIIYLEAKSRYEYDLNINKAKALFNQFLNDADENDGRINEVSSLLVNIETNDYFYDNGFRKFSISYDEVGDKKVMSFNEKGAHWKTTWFSKQDKSLSYTLYDLVTGQRIRTVFMNDEGKISSIIYYLNDIKRVTVVGLGDQVNIYNEQGKLQQTTSFKDKEMSKIYFFKSFESFKNDNYEAYQVYDFWNGSRNITLEYYPDLQIDLIEEHEHLRFAFIKRMKNNYYKNFSWQIDFNSNGLPISKKEYKGEKLKKTFNYNINLMDWEKV